MFRVQVINFMTAIAKAYLLACELGLILGCNIQFFYLYSKHTGEEQLNGIVCNKVNRFHKSDVRLIMKFSRVRLLAKFEPA